MPPKAADAKAKAKAKVEKKPKKEEEEDQNKVEKPDREAFEAEVAKIQEVIDGFQKQQADLAKRIAERSGGKDEFFGKKAELRSQLDEFSKKIDAIMERKNELNQSMGAKKQEGTDMRNQLNKMKKSIGYTSETDIDDRIANIEFRMRTDTISLKEEKDFLKEISELKKNRPKVAQVNNMEEGLKNRDLGGNLREQMQVVNEELTLYRDGKRKVSEKLTELMEGRKEQLGDLPQIIEQRDGIGKKIAEKVKERGELRDAFRAKEREFNQYLAEQRRHRAEKASEERNARNAEFEKVKRQRQADKLDEQPHIQEMTLIEQTMLFCKSLTGSKEKEEKAEKKEIQHDLKDGMEVLTKKEDREEFYYVPTAKKKSKSKNKGAKAEGSSKPIKHNAETFRLFDQLKLDAPITTDDIPATLEKLEAQLEDYKNKVKTWEEKRDEMKKKILEDGYNPEEEAVKEEAAKEEEKAEEKEGEEKKEDE